VPGAPSACVRSAVPVLVAAIIEAVLPVVAMPGTAE
jgi:hypothetical protein